MREIKCVQIDVDSDMDADDYGHRLTECIEQMSENTNVVNLVKVRLGDRISVEHFMRIIQNVAKDIQEMGAKNCVYVPLKKGWIEDITVDYIGVVNDDYASIKRETEELSNPLSDDYNKYDNE
jgi:hypothetical protein